MPLSSCQVIKLTQVKFPQPEEQDETLLPATATPPRKRPRKDINPIEYWSREGSWPKEYFQPEPTEYFEPEIDMDPLLARINYFRGSTLPSPASDEKPREAKSVPYLRTTYETMLAAKRSFMDNSDEGIQKASRDLCQTLLSSEQAYPRDSLFRDDLFHTTCKKIRNRNEAMVVRDILPLIVPSAQTLATYGATHLNHLFESVNQGWNCAKPFYGPRPQPDYSLGFRRSAFTDDQLEKLKPFVGEIPEIGTSFFMGTWEMYFPFLTCEVKCGNQALDIADRQNAHSMTLAVRGIVELFRKMKREKELHLQILAFSLSHDHQMVRIYGHYPLIDGDKTEYYRHYIRAFDFTDLDGKDKWASYRFAKNVYDIWMPTHLERIRSAIDALSPSLADQSTNRAASVLEEPGSSHVDSPDLTTDTSLSQGPSKRPRKRGRDMESPQ